MGLMDVVLRERQKVMDEEARMARKSKKKRASSAKKQPKLPISPY